MSFDELKKNIQDSSVPDRQILKMYLGWATYCKRVDEIDYIIDLLERYRPAIYEILVNEPL